MPDPPDLSATCPSCGVESTTPNPELETGPRGGACPERDGTKAPDDWHRFVVCNNPHCETAEYGRKGRVCADCGMYWGPVTW